MAEIISWQRGIIINFREQSVATKFVEDLFMRKLAFILLLILPATLLARGYSNSNHAYGDGARTTTPHYYSAPQTSVKSSDSYGGTYSTYSSVGNTHFVSSYTRRNGTYVQGHLAGNSGSGVHCHNNVCQ